MGIVLYYNITPVKYTWKGCGAVDHKLTFRQFYPVKVSKYGLGASKEHKCWLGRFFRPTSVVLAIWDTHDKDRGLGRTWQAIWNSQVQMCHLKMGKTQDYGVVISSPVWFQERLVRFVLMVIGVRLRTGPHTRRVSCATVATVSLWSRSSVMRTRDCVWTVLMALLETTARAVLKTSSHRTVLNVLTITGASHRLDALVSMLSFVCLFIYSFIYLFIFIYFFIYSYHKKNIRPYLPMFRPCMV